MSDFVSLFVTHNELSSFCSELRFPLIKSVADIKTQLSTKCGTDAQMMKLVLKDDAQQTLFDALEDNQPLGFYTPYDGYFLHIVNLGPESNRWLEDLDQVEKYTMTDEEYDRREDSFRVFRRRMNANKTEKKTQDDVEIKCDINVGNRCQIDPGDKRGIVRYVGPIAPLKSGIWIGVEYDEPVGKNDGSVDDLRLFECPPMHGGFVRPTKVRVGDFPPLDPFGDEI